MRSVSLRSGEPTAVRRVKQTDRPMVSIDQRTFRQIRQSCPPGRRLPWRLFSPHQVLHAIGAEHF